MKIVKSTSMHHRGYVDEALSASRTDILRIPVWGEGPRIGFIDKNFLLAGLLGLSSRSIAVIGVASRHDHVQASDVELTDSSIEEHLAAALGGYPGIKEIAYSRHKVGLGRCAVVEFQWEYGVRHVIREALGATYVQRHWSRSLEGRATRLSSDFQGSILKTYMDRRQLVEPDAIEARFSVDELPTLLGLEVDRPTRAASVAAFGSNGGVQCAIYVRGWTDQHILAAPSALTEGSHRKRFKPVSLAAGSIAPLHQSDAKSSGWIAAATHVDNSSFSLGEGIFSIVENTGNYVCRAEEVFGADHPVPETFDSEKYSEAVRELLVNAFCHGHWDVWEVGREIETTKGMRMALVHLGDRIELVNRTRQLGYLRSDVEMEVAARKSALHIAFKDIRLAKGRSLGQKLVRHRLASLGMPAPIFVRANRYYRAIMPLRNEFATWGGCVLYVVEILWRGPPSGMICA